MPVGDDHGKTWLRDREFVSRCGQGAVSRAGYDNIKSQFLEVRRPEGKLVVKEHGPRDPNRGPMCPIGRAYRAFQQPVAKVHQIFYHWLAVASWPFAELVRALVSPVAALALDHELFHVAIIRARAAHKLSRGVIHCGEIVAAD